MGSSEICHECCIRNGDKFHKAKPSKICHFQCNKSGKISLLLMLFQVNTILAQSFLCRWNTVGVGINFAPYECISCDKHVLTLQCCANILLLKKSITGIEPTLLWYKHASMLINATMLHEFQPMKLQLQLLTATSEIGINFTAAIGHWNRYSINIIIVFLILFLL